MPEPAKLTKHQQGQIKQGRCGCGCGRNRPREQVEHSKARIWCLACDADQTKEAPEDYEPGPWYRPAPCPGCDQEAGQLEWTTDKKPITFAGRWASQSCRQRGYRQRVKAGTVINKAARKRRADLAHAAELESQAATEDRQAKAAATRRDELNASAKAIRDHYEREDGGQLPLAASRAAK